MYLSLGLLARTPRDEEPALFLVELRHHAVDAGATAQHVGFRREVSLLVGRLVGVDRGAERKGRERNPRGAVRTSDSHSRDGIMIFRRNATRPAAPNPRG